MTEERECPYSVNRGGITTEKFILTHSEWHPVSYYGDFGQPETGIRNADGTDFTLIQHGWWNFENAETFILKALEKGWNATRISYAMDFLKERQIR